MTIEGYKNGDYIINKLSPPHGGRDPDQVPGSINIGWRIVGGVLTQLISGRHIIRHPKKGVSRVR